ncbi:2-oxoisovalerate dehydrogenase subunit beta-related [Anaeramoeba ignava]|uniref:3-methyl-2-oxobutanoate dehydrogenase (2-methylpropanoyl-transferring) n=1 Tax=Anaeramoeba ignava TaxID=1746090 RepID=A0A9Q0LD94_ANAIG|nr:2-oxoisovalerate dehydrogenase subunit beta-related [Anaeramoeba ignava]
MLNLNLQLKLKSKSQIIFPKNEFLRLFGNSIPKSLKLKFLEAMEKSRLLETKEEALKRRGQGVFQMSCMGHEGMIGTSFAIGKEDWIHPYYRDKPIIITRGVPLDHFFLDFFGKANGPSGGRQMPNHYNNKELHIVAGGSTVAANLLQAVGMAMHLKDFGNKQVVITGVGDASTRQGEFMESVAQAVDKQLPVIFLVEDNELGISTRTKGKTFWDFPNSIVSKDDGSKWFMGCEMYEIDGTDPEKVYESTVKAVAKAREKNQPAIILAHLVRLSSHSSSDDQRVYLSQEDIDKIAKRDPVKNYEDKLISENVISREELGKMKKEIQSLIDQAVLRAKQAPNPKEVGSPYSPLPIYLPNYETCSRPKRLPKKEGGLTMAQCISKTIEQEMERNSKITVYGEDIEDPKGEVFSVTKGLSTRFPKRVTNSPLAEATIVGTAAGRALLEGDPQVAFLQFIDFVHPALNQLWTQIGMMHWRSNGQYTTPVVLMASYGAYTPGVGAYHAATSEAQFAHNPGFNIVIPSNAADAAGLLRFALRSKRPVIYLYPKVLLHSSTDTISTPDKDCMIPFGVARIVKPGEDVTIVTYGNTVKICTQAAKIAKEQYGINAEVIDLRTIVPWDERTVLNSIKKTGKLLVVHEDAKTCGMAGEIVSEMITQGHQYLKAPPLRNTKTDDFNPFQYDLNQAILPSVESVVQNLVKLQEYKTSNLKGDLFADNLISAKVEKPKKIEEIKEEKPKQIEEIKKEKLPGEYQILHITLPQVSPSDQDSTLIKLNAKIGDHVKQGAIIAEFEASKGSFELESPYDGEIVGILAKEGDIVLVNKPVFEIHVSNTFLENIPKEKPAKPTEPEKGLKEENKQLFPVVVPRNSPSDEDATIVKFLVKPDDIVKIDQPLADCEANKGSFTITSPVNGRVRQILVNEGEIVPVEVPVIRIEVSDKSLTGEDKISEKSNEKVNQQESQSISQKEPEYQEVILSKPQLQVGALALKSQLETPTVNIQTEVNMTKIEKQRNQLKKKIEEKYHVHVTVTDIILWAVNKAMQTDHNSTFRGILDKDGKKLKVSKNVNLGFAAINQLNEDLYTPVVRNANKLNFIQFCEKVNSLSQKVRNNEIKLDDLQGATLTVTNVGFATKVKTGTPFVIPGQLGMIGVGSIMNLPRFVDGMIIPCNVLDINLVFDHRMHNGSHATRFLEDIRLYLETMDLNTLIN